MTQTIDPSSINVALLMGGKSGEREISLASGYSALKALQEAGFQVAAIDTGSPEDLKTLVEKHFDVAFLALHGKQGEDGTIQGMLEILEIPYTGSGVWSSATAINKPLAKVFYERNGVPTPASLTLLSPEEKTAEEIISVVGEHCVVKAATEGSALGVYICQGKEEVERAIKDVFEIDTTALVETYIEGDEFTVAVLGNENPQALPIIQIIPTHEFYDFESKYAVGGSQHICPAEIDEETQKYMSELAVRAHQALQCRGMSRTDILRDKKGKLWVLETNTIPGMTETSLLPDAAGVAGYSFPELCTEIIRLALEK